MLLAQVANFMHSDPLQRSGCTAPNIKSNSAIKIWQITVSHNLRNQKPVLLVSWDTATHSSWSYDYKTQVKRG